MSKSGLGACRGWREVRAELADDAVHGLTLLFPLFSLPPILPRSSSTNVSLCSPCGHYASDCADPANVSLWWQIPLQSLPAIGELFVNVTSSVPTLPPSTHLTSLPLSLLTPPLSLLAHSYEVAYSRAPARMKSLVLAFFLFSNSLSSALTEALTAVLVDPYLIWPYVALAVATLLCAIALPTYFKHLNEPVSIALESRTEGNASDAASESYDDKKQSIEA